MKTYLIRATQVFEVTGEKSEFILTTQAANESDADTNFTALLEFSDPDTEWSDPIELPAELAAALGAQAKLSPDHEGYVE